MSDDQSPKSTNLNGVRVSWKVQKTKNDIQIVGGTTTVEAQGTAVGSLLVPVQGQPGTMSPAIVIAGDDKQWYIVGLDGCRIL